MMPIRTRFFVASLILLSSPPLAAAAALPVEGSVRTTGGKAPAGALAELVPVLSHLESSRQLLAGNRRPDAVAAAAPEPGDGRFRLEAPEIGLYRVRVSAPGHMPMRSLPLPVTGPLELPPLTLAVAATLDAAVRDAEGRPVAGAWIAARAAAGGEELWREQGSPGWFAAPRLTQSSAGGRASLPRLAVEPLEVDVHAPDDAAPLSFSVLGDRLDVRLEPGTAPRRQVALAGGDAGVVVSVGAARWPAGVLDDAGSLSLAGRFEGRVALHFLSAESPSRSVWLEAEDQRPVYEALPARSFSGRLVDPDGRPLAGALVWPRWDPGVQAITDERGGYTFLRPLSPRFEIRAAAPGFAPGRLALSHGQAAYGTVPDLVLQASGTAAGRVLDDAGRGVASAQVTASPLEGATRRDVTPVYATTAGDGRFELRGLVPGVSHRLTAGRAGHFPAVRDAGGIRPGARRDGLWFVLTPRRGAFGRVVDAGERPLAGIEVVVRPAAGLQAEPESVLTAADGRFEITALPAPRVDLVASGEGYAPLTVPGLEAARRTAGPGAGRVDLGTLILVPSVSIAGVVSAAGGEPLSDAELWVSEHSVAVERLAWEALSRRPPAAVSDARGRFEVGGLGHGQRVDLVVYREGFLPAAVRRVAAPASAPIRVELKPAARIAGQVLGEDLEPIAGAVIALAAAELPAGVSAVPTPIEHDPERGTRSGPDGRFEIAALPPGEVVLEVLARGYQPAAMRPFELGEGEVVGDLEIVLERGATLTGSVTTAGGDPVADAVVAVGRAMATTKPDGSFRVGGIAPGRRTADAWHPHFDRLERQVEIEPGVNVFDFVFASARRLAGRVVDERGAPLPDAAVELAFAGRGGYSEPRTLSDGQGRFRFPRLAEGNYRLEVEKQGWVTAESRLQVDLRDGDVDDLEVVLVPSALLTGEILGLDFAELAGVRLEAVLDDGRRRRGEVSYDGRYRVDDLAPGDWLVSAEAAEGRQRVETRIVLAPGEAEVYRDLEFEEGLALSGRVEYEGEPVAAAHIALRGTDVVASRDLAADHDGRFRFEALEPGSYRLSVSSRWEMFIHNEDVELESDRDLLVELATAGLTGRVVAPDGGGVHDAVVILQQFLRSAGERADGSIFTVGTDAEGAFRFERLPAGRFLARVRKDGYTQLEEELEVAAGTAGDSRTFVLEPTAGIELHLRLASGAVPPAAQVTLLDGGGRPVQSEARSLIGGAARFETLRAGDWRALVAAHGGAPREVALAVPGDPVEIVLPDAGRLRVRVPDLFNSPRRATLTLEDAGGRPFVGLDSGGMPRTAWRVDRGTVIVEGVPAGLWTLRLLDPGGRERIAAVATPGRSEIEVVLD